MVQIPDEDLARLLEKYNDDINRIPNAELYDYADSKWTEITPEEWAKLHREKTDLAGFILGDFWVPPMLSTD